MNRTTDITALVRPNIMKLKPYSSARDEFDQSEREMVFLDANENPFENGVNRYPDPQQRSLKTELASIKGTESSHILLGNGSDEVLDLIFRVFCEPGKDNIISLPPTYGMYSVLAATNDIENREVLLTGDFQPDVNKILNAVDEQTKIVFLCSPNNPTGNSFSEEAVTALLNGFKGMVVIDEAYIDFSENESWLNRLEDYPNLIVTQTLSKAYGVAGIRIGVCYASSLVIELLNKIKPPYNVNKLSQERALKRLLNREEVEKEVQLILGEKQKLYKALENVSFVRELFRSDANFILARVDDATRRYDQLIAAGVVVRNRTSQPLCENTLRFTVGTSEENERLLEALKKLEQ
ncbi:histidinol-phosphate transaminase [Leptobacterium flavescens]|uniref:Histidinol-phosphate aminotransferase n=1 Tax=Leptobacterium flavescens TaxID=472055 RepID=A0A6P0UP72_9FLAO|nr:histidinol-phosphate transaminase [Leptobacterium flavescens]NER13748.1 histidinol-phosphate transaminase [Leptobacterium flavescens]